MHTRTFYFIQRGTTGTVVTEALLKVLQAAQVSPRQVGIKMTQQKLIAAIQLAKTKSELAAQLIISCQLQFTFLLHPFCESLHFLCYLLFQEMSV